MQHSPLIDTDTKSNSLHVPQTNQSDKLVKEAAFILNNQVKKSASKKNNLLFYGALSGLAAILVVSFISNQAFTTELIASSGIISCLMIIRKFGI